MVGIIVVTRAALLIARRTSTWTIDAPLGGLSPECVAVDLRSPAKLYCGTARDGLFRSRARTAAARSGVLAFAAVRTAGTGIERARLRPGGCHRPPATDALKASMLRTREVRTRMD